MANKKRTSGVTPSQIIATRGALSQTQAAKIVGLSLRQWQYFEAGTVNMSDAVYFAFQHRAKAIELGYEDIRERQVTT